MAVKRFKDDIKRKAPAPRCRSNFQRSSCIMYMPEQLTLHYERLPQGPLRAAKA